MCCKEWCWKHDQLDTQNKPVPGIVSGSISLPLVDKGDNCFRILQAKCFSPKILNGDNNGLLNIGIHIQLKIFKATEPGKTFEIVFYCCKLTYSNSCICKNLWAFGIRNNENEIIEMSHEVRVLWRVWRTAVVKSGGRIWAKLIQNIS